MDTAKVILIGGTSGAGKSTLAHAVATRLGRTSLSIDDLFLAAKAVTTSESHPGLHVMNQPTFTDYFTAGPPERLIADTDTQHEATWPVVERVIRSHAGYGTPIVIDGWTLRPDRVVALDLDNVASFWVVADPAVLEARERKNTDFIEGSPDPERMFQNFLARSRWYNEFTREEATKHGLPILYQDGTVSVDDLCDRVVRG